MWIRLSAETDRNVLLEICADEGIATMSEADILAQEKPAQDVFKQVDTDGSGEISFAEFTGNAHI